MSRPSGRLVVFLGRYALASAAPAALGTRGGEEGFGEAFLRRSLATAFAGPGSAPNGLEPVLTEGGEVDREVDGVGQAVG
ncbi:MAG TPA: hypothetical protein VFB52_02090 [Solirubrobacterales bacterium]|nr:hypothetical protein [Solirubrobacterales bacterium]